MLGDSIHDPDGAEDRPGSCNGFGWLPMETTLFAEKQLRNVHGTLSWNGAAVAGFEIHTGISSGPALARPALRTTHGFDGAVSSDDRILGTYVHGLFECPTACDGLLAWAGLRDVRSPDYRSLREQCIERLADAVDDYLDTSRLAHWLTATPDTQESAP